MILGTKGTYWWGSNSRNSPGRPTANWNRRNPEHGVRRGRLQRRLNSTWDSSSHQCNEFQTRAAQSNNETILQVFQHKTSGGVVEGVTWCTLGCVRCVNVVPVALARGLNSPKQWPYVIWSRLLLFLVGAKVLCLVWVLLAYLLIVLSTHSSCSYLLRSNIPCVWRWCLPR